jgi:hypothetical protein
VHRNKQSSAFAALMKHYTSHVSADMEVVVSLVLWWLPILAAYCAALLPWLPAVRELAPPGDIASAAQKPLPFEFRNVEMQYDSYRGLQVRCRCGPGQQHPLYLELHASSCVSRCI